MNTMTEVKIREPRDWMRRMVQELDRLFDEPAFLPFRVRRRELDELGWMPDLELIERDDRLVARLDLPGLKSDEITVEAADGALTISGERKREAQEKSSRWARSERVYGRFDRMIPLPEGVRPADVKATFIDGVLEVTLPLPAEATASPARRVPVEAPGQGRVTTAA